MEFLISMTFQVFHDLYEPCLGKSHTETMHNSYATLKWYARNYNPSNIFACKRLVKTHHLKTPQLKLGISEISKFSAPTIAFLAF